MTQKPEQPTLTRVGSGRSARLGALAAVVLLGGSIAVALADRPPTSLPVPTLAAISPTASATATAAAARNATPTPTPTPAAGSERPPEADARRGAFLLATLSSGESPVVRHALAGLSDPTAFIIVPPEMWRAEPRLSLGWVGFARDGRQVELAVMPLSLGSGADPGLPIEQSAGSLLLPGAVDGTIYWDYRILIDRAHGFSNPHEWAVVVEMTPLRDGPRCRLRGSPWARGDC